MVSGAYLLTFFYTIVFSRTPVGKVLLSLPVTAMLLLYTCTRPNYSTYTVFATIAAGLCILSHLCFYPRRPDRVLGSRCRLPNRSTRNYVDLAQHPGNAAWHADLPAMCPPEWYPACIPQGRDQRRCEASA